MSQFCPEISKSYSLGGGGGFPFAGGWGCFHTIGTPYIELKTPA